MFDALQRIIDEALSVPEEELIYDIDTPVTTGETVIGELTLEERKLQSGVDKIEREYGRKMSLAYMCIEIGLPVPDNRNLKDLSRIGGSSNLLDAILFFQIRDRLDVWDKSIGKRVGRQIVSIPDPAIR